MNGRIYCYTNLINNKKYIGQTIQEDNGRFNQHYSSAFNPRASDYDTPFHRAIRKYGYDNFSLEILEANIHSLEEMNELEAYYIKQLQSLTTQNGYNIESGGKNSKKVFSVEHNKNLSLAKGSLTEEEVIQLRIAYKQKQSPKKIYDALYKDRLHYNAFLNIWSGRKYKHILPEYIEKGRHTKISFEQAEEIRKKYAQGNMTYKKLSIEYNVDPSTIGNIVKYKTHKPKEPVSTIPGSGK